MEIDKNKLNKNTKAILNYCLCILLFFILNNNTVSGHVIDFIFGILKLDNDIKIAIDEDMALLFTLVVIILHIYIYNSNILWDI